MEGYSDTQRKSFFAKASTKLSDMLEDRVFEEDAMFDFSEWCHRTFDPGISMEIAEGIWFEFAERISQENSRATLNVLDSKRVNAQVFKPTKSLRTCDFAESLYTHIFWTKDLTC